MTMPVQCVELLLRYEGMPCPYCAKAMTLADGKRGRRAPTRDHVRPRCKGATLASFKDLNRLLVCRTCNHAKGSRSLVEFYAWLRERNDPRAHHVARTIHALRESAPSGVFWELVGMSA